LDLSERTGNLQYDNKASGETPGGSASDKWNLGLRQHDWPIKKKDIISQATKPGSKSSQTVGGSFITGGGKINLEKRLGRARCLPLTPQNTSSVRATKMHWGQRGANTLAQRKTEKKKFRGGHTGRNSARGASSEEIKTGKQRKRKKNCAEQGQERVKKRKGIRKKTGCKTAKFRHGSTAGREQEKPGLEKQVQKLKRHEKRG